MIEPVKRRWEKLSETLKNQYGGQAYLNKGKYRNIIVVKFNTAAAVRDCLFASTADSVRESKSG